MSASLSLGAAIGAVLLITVPAVDMAIQGLFRLFGF